MEALNQLNARVIDLAASNDNLSLQVEEANGKTDALIVAVGTVLTRLQELIDAANQGGNVTAADIQAVSDKVQAVLDKQVTTVAALNAQDVQTDAATAAANAAGTPAVPPAPTGTTAPVDGSGSATPPPQDDAFVAVGSTRFSDAAVQTEETYAAAVKTWNEAHPDGPVAG